MMRGNRRRPMEETGDSMSGLKRLAGFCRPYLPAIAIALFFALVGTVCTIIGPDKLSELTDILTQGLMQDVDMEAVGRICWTLVAFYGVSALASLFQSWVMTTVTQRVSRKMRSAISSKINRLPIDYYNHTSFGDVLSRVTNDVDTVGEAVQRSVVSLVSAAALFIGCLFMMFRTNALMALTAILSSLLGFGMMGAIMGRSQRYFQDQQQALGELNGHIEEAFSGHDVLKVYNAEAQMGVRFDQLNDRLYSSNWRSQFLSGLMQPLMGFVGNFGYVAVCVVGAALAMSGRISFGVIVAFMVYVRLFTNPLSQMAQGMTQLQSASAAAGRVFDFLDAEEMADESRKTRKLESPKGEVEFDHVKFGYTPDRIVIHDFSEHIHPGMKVAIVGPTGAGKTTLVNLLMRFYELNGGEIRIDGVPATDLTRANIHDLFGMVLQDTWLFEGTIRENVVYGKENVPDERLQQVCRAVGMHHFIQTLPRGYDTVIDDKLNLSEGQKQLLTIARAMIEDAPMLILDEATSSVDTRTELLIQRAMDELTKGRTSFVIAHRLSTIRNADLILVLKDGDVIESGTHESLLQQGGFYAELYNSQFEPAA